MLAFYTATLIHSVITSYNTKILYDKLNHRETTKFIIVNVDFPNESDDCRVLVFQPGLYHV